MALKDVAKQYQVTYDSGKGLHFIMHHELASKPNMIFKMHPSGLHYFDPNDKDFMFITTVTKNKKDFMK